LSQIRTLHTGPAHTRCRARAHHDRARTRPAPDPHTTVQPARADNLGVAPAVNLALDTRHAIASRLRPGDVLLYKASSLFGWLIHVKTGGPVSHVEVSAGWLTALASRDRKGVNLYELRLEQLAYVLRPAGFNLDTARMWFDQVARGQPYGWLDLAYFFGWYTGGPGMVCSPFATYLLRAGQVPIFGQIAPERIAPNDFLLSELLTDVTAEVLGTVPGTAPGTAATPPPAVTVLLKTPVPA
jgi:hypothetical protein